jgi:acetoin utilization deacetylase AcuC-like enzyme
MSSGAASAPAANHTHPKNIASPQTAGPQESVRTGLDREGRGTRNFSEVSFMALRGANMPAASESVKRLPSARRKNRDRRARDVVESRRVKIITDERCSGYHRPGHPERPARITATLARLREQTALPITWARPGPVEEASLLRAHSAEHLARLRIPEDFDADTPYHPHIADFARLSVGAALEAMRCARAGESVFSLMRPPGHHATRDRAMGFCYLNSIAVAVLEARAAGVPRVAVFDFDVHHGNGTEAILLDQPGTAFFSVHQYPCYPGTGTAHRGENCFNFPVPPETPREEYRQVLERALEALKRFQPELVGVSAGFDAYAGDPIAQETLEAEDFYWLGRQLRALGVPVFSVLEGGYSRDLPELILVYLRGLDGL